MLAARAVPFGCSLLPGFGRMAAWMTRQWVHYATLLSVHAIGPIFKFPHRSDVWIMESRHCVPARITDLNLKVIIRIDPAGRP